MPATPVAAPYTNELISSYDLLDPQRLNELFASYGDQGLPFFQTIRSMGYERPVTQVTYGHYEEELRHTVIHNLLAINNVVAGSSQVVTLSPVDVDAQNRFYPRKYQIVTLQSRITCVITNIDVTTPTAPILTIIPQDPTDTIGVVAVGEEISLTSNQHSEGSGQPLSAVTPATLHTMDSQIIKETVSSTGTQMTNSSYVTVYDGKGLPAYYRKGQLDMDYRMALQIDGAFLTSKRTTNPLLDTDPQTGNPHRSTEGIYPFISRRGYTHTYTIGSWDLVNDFDTLDFKLAQQFVSSPSVWTGLGHKLMQEIENDLKDYTDAATDYSIRSTNNNLFKGNEDLAISVGFRYFKKSNRCFVFSRINNFTNITTYGATGYDYVYSGFMLPLGEAKVRSMTDKSAMQIPFIGYRYKALGDYSRRMEYWKDGAAGNGLKIGDLDLALWYQRCDMGTHFACGNQMILINSL